LNFKNKSFQQLPFSALFQNYTAHFEKIAAFYETNPFSAASIKSRAQSVKFQGNREKLVELLLQFNRQFKVDEKAIKNIKKLASGDALALVTGQQLGLFGGPLYTFYKTISVIHLARHYEAKLERPVIPVFWMADEDHDFEEVKSVNILTSNGVKEISLPANPAESPVSELTYSRQINAVKRQLKEHLIDTDFSNDLGRLLDDCFQPENTFLKGFGSFISKLFSKHGLVLAGSNNRPVKEATKEALIQSVLQADKVEEALNETSKRLEQNFHQQVKLNDSHLFYLSPQNGRQKIVRGKESWETMGGLQWSAEELAKNIEDDPASFSPDVFLRPIIQDKLLPTLGYVGGPGEVAYYGQMKSFYRIFDLKMPVIFPRFSATFVEPAIARISQELPFKFNDYEKRIEDLEKAYVQQTGEMNIEAVFKKWKKGIEDLEAYHSKLITQVDETLNGTSKKAQAHYFNELERLKGKTYRAIKKNEDIQMNRIRRIQNNFFPDRNLQERALCGIYYMNKYGIDIWDRVLENLNDSVDLRQHTLIYL